MLDDKNPNGDGAGGEPAAPKHTFKTDDDFLSAAKTRAKPWVTEAKKEARAQAEKEILERLGIESLEQLDEVKAKSGTATAAQTEAEKIKTEHSKLSKEYAKLEKANKDLLGYKHVTLKQKALAPHAGKFRAAADLDAYLAPILSVDDDGAVVGPDGKGLEDTIGHVLETYPHLRAPDYKAGGGTSPVPPKPPGAQSNGQDTRTPAQRQRDAELGFEDALKKSWQGGNVRS